MSAWIVSKAHIDALVTVARFGPKGHDRHDWYAPSWSMVDEEGRPYSNGREAPCPADCLGAMLWIENYKSVNYRYSDETIGESLPGPFGLTLADIRGYTHRQNELAPRLTAVEALKAIDCYEYQACEHPEWEDSQARKFCDLLRRAVISALPGYDAAPWGIDDNAGCDRCGVHDRIEGSTFCEACIAEDDDDERIEPPARHRRRRSGVARLRGELVHQRGLRQESDRGGEGGLPLDGKVRRPPLHGAGGQSQQQRRVRRGRMDERGSG